MLCSHLCRSFQLVISALICCNAAADFPHQQVVQSDIHDLVSVGVSLVNSHEYLDWLTKESELSFDKMLNNIAYEGSDLLQDGVLPGSVVASPSRFQPDYFYIWTRDGAIIMNTVLYKYANDNSLNDTLGNILSLYVNSTYDLQRISNPSGDFQTLEGLGEPKFHVDGSSFKGSWGRPQRDGPALRANVIMDFMSLSDKFDETTGEIFSQVIKPDLEYVAKFWRETGFDLWEEVNGIHFFTLQVQAKAMATGAKFANKLGEFNKSKHYNSVAADIRQVLRDDFFDPNQGYIKETLHFDQRSGIDVAAILATLYSSDSIGHNFPDELLSFHSDEILATLHSLVTDMRTRFPINSARLNNFKSAGAITSLIGVGIGRYPEDVYDGTGNSIGNPWFLCTAAVAETLYGLAHHLHSRSPEFILEINSINLEFYRQFLGSSSNFGVGFTIAHNETLYEKLICQLINYGDSFLDVIREHQDTEGNLSEQFSRETGYMVGADKLTWSFGQFYRATKKRQVVLQDMYKTSMISQDSCIHMTM